MTLQNMIEQKRDWRKFQARVKQLPQDYQVVYKEIQRYIFKVGLLALEAGDFGVLEDLVDLFEEGAASGRAVLEVTGDDVAAFVDGILEGEASSFSVEQANASTQAALEKGQEKLKKSMEKYLDKL